MEELETEQEVQESKTLTLGAVMLMIFAAVFGFGNTTVAYYDMGYAGIIWYVLGALLFFIPSSLMFAEYGSALHNQQGVYSWLKSGIGEKWAFIGGFVWLSSWVIMTVATVSKVWVMLATTISGHDTTSTWHLFGLDSDATIGVLSILLFLLITFISTQGLNGITRLAGIAGFATLALTAFFALFSLLLLVKNGFHFQESLTLHKFLISPRTSYQSPSAMVSFLVFAVYAYGGIEAMGSATNRMKHAKRDFPRAMIWSAILMTVFYAVLILLMGASGNWTKLFKDGTANLGNVTYVLLGNLGLVLGQSFHLSAAGAQAMSFWFERFGAFAMLISYVGGFFVTAYLPIKSFILGTPKRLWPGKIGQLNKHEMPAVAMWIQAGIVSVLMLLTSLDALNAAGFYNVLTLMDTLSDSFPYLFLITAFPFFKRRTDLERPFVIFKTPLSTWAVTIIVDAMLMVGLITTVMSGVEAHAYGDIFLEFIGPVLFGLMGYALYRVNEHEKKEELG